jgi:hypothetical protein
MIETTGAALLINVLSDYVSLFLIRRGIALSAKYPVWSQIRGFLVAAAIVYLSLGVRFLTTFLAGRIFPVNGFDYDHIDPAEFPFTPAFLFVPAVLVFAWLPLFSMGLIVLRLATPISTAISKMQWFLKDGTDHPLNAVGIVAGTVVFVCAAAWQFFLKSASS